ncbi:MAG: hypothetical protein NVSMB17_19640 [Candidatus Dormibacteria bacterium]
MGATLLTAQASVIAAPAVTRLSAALVNPGDPISVQGSDFTDTDSCNSSIGDVPHVDFLNVGDQSPITTANPVDTSSANCAKGQINVKVPDLPPGGARVRVVDSHGQGSNSNLLVTLKPSVSLSPSSGPVCSSLTLNGTHLHPPTVAPGDQLQLSYPGANQAFPSWSDGGGFTFNSGSASATATVTYHVSTDATNPGGGLQTATASASFTLQAPQVNGGTLTATTVDNPVTITGSNLGPQGSVTFSPGLAGRVTQWGSGQVQAVVPQGADDVSQVTVKGCGYSLAGPKVPLNPLARGLSPSQAKVGQDVVLSGFNLGRSGAITVAGLGEQVTRWTGQAVTFTVSPDTDPGAVTLTRSDGLSAAAPVLGITPELTKLENDRVPAGTPVVVDGTGFGSATGTATVGGRPVTPQLWSRATALIPLPTDLAAGSYPIVVSTAAGVTSNELPVTITAAPPAPKSPTGAAAPAASPVYDLNHQFVKPPKVPSPVDLSLDAQPKKVAAGKTAIVTVTLKLNGKPVRGAQVKLSMIFAPGTDYSFTPNSGVTDENGTFKASVKVSSKPGDNIILAESGIFSDQDRVVGQGAPGSGPGGIVNPAGGVPVPLVALGGVAVVLISGGLFVNLRAHGWI